MIFGCLFRLFNVLNLLLIPCIVWSLFSPCELYDDHAIYELCNGYTICLFVEIARTLPPFCLISPFFFLPWWSGVRFDDIIFLGTYSVFLHFPLFLATILLRSFTSRGSLIIWCLSIVHQMDPRGRGTWTGFRWLSRLPRMRTTEECCRLRTAQSHFFQIVLEILMQ